LVVVIVLIPYIDDVNIYLTDVAFAGKRIFTPSTFGSAIQTRGRLSQHWASNIAIATRFRDLGHPPTPRTGFARGRLFTSKSRPQTLLLAAVKRTDTADERRRTCLPKRCSELASPLASLPVALSEIIRSVKEVRAWLPEADLSNLRLHPGAHHTIEIEQPEGRTDSISAICSELMAAKLKRQRLCAQRLALTRCLKCGTMFPNC
jgi:hypothetical protein